MASDRVVKILQAGYRKIRDLLEADRVYVALYDPRRKYLEFPLVEPQDEKVSAESMRWNERPLRAPERPANNGVHILSPDRVIDERKSVLDDHVAPAEFEAGKLTYWPDESLPRAWLGVPLVAEDQILGALVVENRRQAGVFESKVDLSTTVARNLAIAVANAQLREQMERQITRLTALYKMGQQLTASIQLSEQKIIELIYEQASRVMDTKNMYIALYDETTDTVRFALAYRDDRRVDIEKEDGWQPRAGGLGRTEEIIRTRKPLFTALRSESEAWYREENRKDYIEQPFASWVGVPMIASQKVLGVIATYHATREYVYDEDDVQMLAMLASQAAMAIENARLYAGMEQQYAGMEQQVEVRTKEFLRERERADAAEKLALMSDVAAEFAHRMNNLAGTIPVRVGLAKENLDPGSSRDKKIMKQLDGITGDAKVLLDAAREIRKSSEIRYPEVIDVADAIEIAAKRVELSKLNVEEGRIRIESIFAEDLPYIYAERNRFLDTLESLMRNSVDAMPTGGTLTIKAQQREFEGRQYIEITISDTGIGIVASDLPKIFDLFFTTKKTNLGFGLWRDRMFIKQLGGDIEIVSSENKGTTVTVRIPVFQTDVTLDGGKHAER